MKATEKAYLAGLLDGEGSVMITNPFPLQLIVTVAQDERRANMIEWVKNTFPQFKDHTLAASNYEGNNSTILCASAKGVEAKKVLLKTLPYLVAKKPQARLGIAFQILKTERNRVYRHVRNEDRIDAEYNTLIASVQEMMKRLNKRGNDYVPVAETERENLISLCRAKAQEIRKRQSTPEGL